MSAAPVLTPWREPTADEIERARWWTTQDAATAASLREAERGPCADCGCSWCPGGCGERDDA